MKTVILCGGSGTRLREMSEFIPKPMIPIGGKPMLYHIMKIYSHYGFNSFVLALGYKQEIIKSYFNNFDYINRDVIRFYIGSVPITEYLDSNIDPWRVSMIDTGEATLKGGRLKRVQKHVTGDNFFCTYGDGISDINLKELLEFHLSHKKIATVTGIHPAPRFGEIHRDGGKVISFSEKPLGGDLINGGFFVFTQGIFDYLCEDEWCDLEVGPMELLANKGELMVYEHKGFWGCLDTLKDLDGLQSLWKEGKAPWKVW